MRSLTNVYVIGHLATDVEVRQTKNGAPVSSFPVAVNRLIKAEGGEKKEVVDFHRVVAFGRLAEVCSDYLAKGSAVFLGGRLVNHSFEDKSGNRHYRTEILANDVSILTWKKAKAGKPELDISALENAEPEVEVVE